MVGQHAPEFTIVGLVVAALTGLGALSFKTPELARKILNPMMVICAAAGFIVNAYNIGGQFAYIESRNYLVDTGLIKPEHTAMANVVYRKISDKMKASGDFFFKLNVYYWIFFIYIFILIIISWTVDSHNRDSKRQTNG